MAEARDAALFPGQAVDENDELVDSFTANERLAERLAGAEEMARQAIRRVELLEQAAELKLPAAAWDDIVPGAAQGINHLRDSGQIEAAPERRGWPCCCCWR